MDELTTNPDDSDVPPHEYDPRDLAAEDFESLQPGDRVLWGERSQPCTVARVVDPEDRVGQSLAFSVMPSDTRARQKRQAKQHWCDREFPDDFFLRPGDVFADPDSWGTLRGKHFVVIHGPRGGFYAIAEPESGRDDPALFRAVRSYHSTVKGQPGQGAWQYETDVETPIAVTEHGEAPDTLDPDGDLPAYDEIEDNRVVAYVDDEHVTVTDSVAALFDEGMHEAHERARAEHDTDDSEPDDEIPVGARPERVDGTPRGTPNRAPPVTVTDIVATEYGPKGVIDAPAPWDTPDSATPANDVIKSTPWDENHYEFDGDREAWLVDAEELSATTSVLREHGYTVRAEYDLPDDWPAE